MFVLLHDNQNTEKLQTDFHSSNTIEPRIHFRAVPNSRPTRLKLRIHCVQHDKSVSVTHTLTAFGPVWRKGTEIFVSEKNCERKVFPHRIYIDNLSSFQFSMLSSAPSSCISRPITELPKARVISKPHQNPLPIRKIAKKDKRRERETPYVIFSSFLTLVLFRFWEKLLLRGTVM